MAKAWKIAPGEGAGFWDMCRDQGCIALGWRALRDYRRFKSEDEILKKLSGEPGDGSGAAKSIWRFVHQIKANDVVIANAGRSSVVGIGVVTSEYLSPKSPKNPSESEDLPHARLVDWTIRKSVDFEHMIFSPPTIHRVKPEQCEEIKKAYVKKYPSLRKDLDRVFEAVLVDDDDSSSMDEFLAVAEQKLEDEGAFNPEGVTDAREHVLSSIVRRRGQPAFRKHLLMAYKGRCAVTGCEVEAILEAAHIVPYKGPTTNHPANGLLLRTDFHTLFDLGLVAVDVATMSLLVSPDLNGTGYDKYQGKRVNIPERTSRRPSCEALEQHRHKCGLSR